MTFPAFIFDTETSGLLHSRLIPLARQPSIIEFYGAMVDLDAGPDPLWELDTLLTPSNGQPLSEEINRITGIDDAMLVGKPTFEAFAPLLTTVLNARPVVIAHNASFDLEMVDVEYDRILQRIVWSDIPILCTVEQTIHLKGHRLTLQGLHEHLFGERFKEAHRARNDVAALIRCCVELRKMGCL